MFFFNFIYEKNYLFWRITLIIITSHKHRWYSNSVLRYFDIRKFDIQVLKIQSGDSSFSVSVWNGRCFQCELKCLALTCASQYPRTRLEPSPRESPGLKTTRADNASAALADASMRLSIRESSKGLTILTSLKSGSGGKWYGRRGDGRTGRERRRRNDDWYGRRMYYLSRGSGCTVPS